MPREWINPQKFPFKCFNWEKDGKIYNKLKIRKWKDKLPDVSKLIKSMVTKKITGTLPENFDRLVKESCIAELAHIVLMFLGFGCMYIWQGKSGVVMGILYAIGNLPFIIIQRYNRPNIKRIAKKLKTRRSKINPEYF